MSRSRSHVNRRVDKRVIAKTVRRTHPLNVPGRVMQRGGIRL